MIFGNRIPAELPRILVSADEDSDVIKFAAKVAKGSNAAILSLFVQAPLKTAINHLESNQHGSLPADPFIAAQEVFRVTRTICEDAGVPVLQIYAIHNNPGEIMLDHAATWGVDAVVMGTHRNPTLPPGQREIDLQRICAELPPGIPLILRGT